MSDTIEREFHLGDVLSIITGKLLSPRHMDGIYDILNFMANDKLFTHQLPRVAKEARPYLVEQFPQLKGVSVDGVDRDNFRQRLDDLCAEFGETVMVRRLPLNAHEFIDWRSELAEKVHPDRIIEV